MTFFDLIITGFTFITFFVGIALVLRPSVQGLNNRLIAFAFLILSAVFSYLILRSTGLLVKFPHLLRIFSPFIYIIGPLFYFYVRNGMLGKSKINKIDWLHFMPAVLHFLELIPFYMLDVETKRSLASQIVEDINVLFRQGGGIVPIAYHYILRVLSLVIYAFFISRLVFTPNVQYPIKPYFKWIKGVSISYVIITVLNVGILANGILTFDPNLESLDSLFLVVVLLLLVSIGFGLFLFSRPVPKTEFWDAAAKNSQAFNRAEVANNTLEAKDYLEQKYGNGKAKPLANRIKAIIEDPNYYKNPELKVSDISNALGLPTRDLSYIATEYFGMRLNEMVNFTRVSEAKRLMNQNAHASKTIDAIGSEAGFNSRSTFYRIFKQLENCTPNDYCQNKAQG
jgi:AraC-like DNA-binding protein